MECSVEQDGLSYEGNIIRPPSEAYSIILQVTVGCSHNKCTFCPTYKGERFKIKDDKTILGDLNFAAKYMRRQDRLFIADGDALIIPQKRLVRLMEQIREKLPQVKRIGLYGNVKSIKMKTDEELRQLKDLGLGIVYLGIESGDDVILEQVKKGTTAAEQIEQGKRIMAAGIKLSVTVLIGLGGPERSHEHARATGALLTELDPDYVGALTLMLPPNTELGQAYRRGEFTLPGPEEMLSELREMIDATEMSRGLFFANHASNYVPVKIRFPGPSKQQALIQLDAAIAGKSRIKPEWMRAL